MRDVLERLASGAALALLIFGIMGWHTIALAVSQ